MWTYYILATIVIGALILIVSIKVLQSRKSAHGESITKDCATAWQTLNADLITKHLSHDFKYDSQWVYETLDYKEYILNTFGENSQL